MITFDNVLVDACSSRDIVGFHREHFLQGVRGTISLKRPDLHLTKG
jgi:hypothetical protein